MAEPGKTNGGADPMGRSGASQSQQEGERVLFIGAKRALIGGLLAASVALAGQWFVGQVYSGSEARQLIEALVPSARSVGTSVVTASGTILALMLTMLSLTSQAETSFDSSFYQRVQRIGLLSTIALAAGILLLLLLSIPLQESKNLPGSWYSMIYYLLIALTASLAGLLIAIVLMLLNAVTSLIAVLRPNKDADVTRQGKTGAGQSNGEAGSQSAPDKSPR